MMKYKSILLLFCALMTCGFVIANPVTAQDQRPQPSDFGRTWQDAPIIPTISDNSLRILKEGIQAGNNAHAFSKVGDCDTSTTWYLADYDLDERYYDLGEYSQFSTVIEFFKGSFGRTSLTATPGFSAASVLSSYWTNYEVCTYDEIPLTCEYRIQNPLIVLISLGTNDGYNPPSFKDNMRIIIETTLEQHRLPVLMTKADNVEGNFSINQDIFDLAKEYDIPLWNFWAAIQHLDNGGLQEDNIHLTHYDSYFSHSKNFETAWAYRNLTALQILEQLKSAIEPMLETSSIQ